MKKWIAVFLASLMLLSLCAAAAENVSYADWDYFQFEELTDDDWDAKAIVYQFIGGDPSDPSATQGYTFLHSIVLVNLYEDGTMLYWQAGHYYTDDLPEECVWYDQDRFIRWAYFGTWAEADGALQLHFTKYYSEQPPVWFDVTASQDNGAYTIEGLPATMPAQSNDGEQKNLMFPVVSDGTVPYPTLQGWVDEWISLADTFDEL